MLAIAGSVLSKNRARDPREELEAHLVPLAEGFGALRRIASTSSCRYVADPLRRSGAVGICVRGGVKAERTALTDLIGRARAKSQRCHPGGNRRRQAAAWGVIDTCGERGLFQRCHAHKKRNDADALADRMRTSIHSAMNQPYAPAILSVPAG